MKEVIRKIVEEKLENEPFFIFDIEISADGRQIEVFLDGDDGVDIGTCAKVSRHLGNTLDELDMMDHSYNLQVSSPGLDRPLKFKSQYRRNVGRRLKVTREDGSVSEGKLVFFDDDKIILATEEAKSDEKEIELKTIKKAFVVI